ncbi:hypothetical protein GJ496_001781 [Pomphorhynchus laevis]|nr:hypothetical protein GJ496_001781 [Pomphorhynchus laevis]
MRQAEERYQRSLIKSPTTALPKDRDQERNFQMTDEFQMSNNKQHLFACNLNPQPRCSKINPWDSLMAIQQRGEDSKW